MPDGQSRVLSRRKLMENECCWPMGTQRLFTSVGRRCAYLPNVSKWKCKMHMIMPIIWWTMNRPCQRVFVRMRRKWFVRAVKNPTALGNDAGCTRYRYTCIESSDCLLACLISSCEPLWIVWFAKSLQNTSLYLTTPYPIIQTMLSVWEFQIQKGKYLFIPGINWCIKSPLIWH
jgi:hypothetical protein